MVVICMANAFLQRSPHQLAGWRKLRIEEVRKTRRQRARDRNRHFVAIYCIRFYLCCKQIQVKVKAIVVFQIQISTVLECRKTVLSYLAPASREIIAAAGKVQSKDTKSSREADDSLRFEQQSQDYIKM